jgi:hypothetical protein
VFYVKKKKKSRRGGGQKARKKAEAKQLKADKRAGKGKGSQAHYKRNKKGADDMQKYRDVDVGFQVAAASKPKPIKAVKSSGKAISSNRESRKAAAIKAGRGTKRKR